MKAKRDYGYTKFLDVLPAEWVRKGKPHSTLPNYLPAGDEFSEVRSELEWEATYWGVSMAELSGASVQSITDPSLDTNPLRGPLRGAANSYRVEVGICHVLEQCGAVPALPRLTAWLSSAGYRNPNDDSNGRKLLTQRNVELACMRLIASGLIDI